MTRIIETFTAFILWIPLHVLTMCIVVPMLMWVGGSLTSEYNKHIYANISEKIECDGICIKTLTFKCEDGVCKIMTAEGASTP